MLKRLFDWQSGSVHAVAVAAIFGKRKAAITNVVTVAVGIVAMTAAAKMIA